VVQRGKTRLRVVTEEIKVKAGGPVRRPVEVERRDAIEQRPGVDRREYERRDRRNGQGKRENGPDAAKSGHADQVCQATD